MAKLPECIGRVAALGYCLGGLMTFLTAVRYGVDAAVVSGAGISVIGLIKAKAVLPVLNGQLNGDDVAHDIDPMEFWMTG